MHDTAWWSFFGSWVASIVQVLSVLGALTCAILFARCSLTQTELELRIAKFEEKISRLPRDSRIADAMILDCRSRVRRLRHYQQLLGAGILATLFLFFVVTIATNNPAPV